jgi:hypothetical protein
VRGRSVGQKSRDGNADKRVAVQGWPVWRRRSGRRRS